MNQSRGWRVLGVCATLALGQGLVAFAADDRFDQVGKFEQVLVFHNGRTLKGKISRSPNGYVVEHLAGRLVVPFEETRVVGNNLPDAYHRLRESFVNPTAATHYELAQWCYSHQLIDDARAELVVALDRDADFEAARELMQRIDTQLAAARKKAAAPPLKASPKRMIGEVELPEVESLAGLSRETAAQYTARIQPLLLNKCGNAGCHGSQSETAFRLNSLRGTGAGHRVHSERNLALVLKQIDLARPERSPLLQAPIRSHGGLSKAIFYGPAGEKQLQMLKDWVRITAKEVSAQGQLAEQRPSVIPKPAASQKSLQKSTQTTVSESTSNPSPTRMASVSPESEDETQELDDATDAFDPAEFNRRFHGPSGEPDSRAGKRSSTAARKSKP